MGFRFLEEKMNSSNYVLGLSRGHTNDLIQHESHPGDGSASDSIDVNYPGTVEPPAHVSNHLRETNDDSSVPPPSFRDVTGTTSWPAEPSIMFPASRRNPSKEDWRKIRPIFTTLYVVDNKPLKEVRDMLQEKYNFIAR